MPPHAYLGSKFWVRIPVMHPRMVLARVVPLVGETGVTEKRNIFRLALYYNQWNYMSIDFVY